MTSHLTVMT